MTRIAGLRRIALDFLSQAVDVGLERVRRHLGVVAPHLLQKRVSRHYFLIGAVEIPQDRGFLLGQLEFEPLSDTSIFEPGLNV